MRRVICTVLMVLGVCMMASAQKYYDKVKIKTQMDSVSYSLGMIFAKNCVQQGITELNADAVGKAFRDVLANRETSVDSDDVEPIVMAFFANILMEKKNKMLEAEKAFFEQNLQNPGVKQTESGLQYLVVTEGTGAKPSMDKAVTIQYEGKLIDGTVFESSFDEDEPQKLNLDYIIPGLAEGIQLMSEGAEYIFYIPQELAYGDYSPSEDIPEYSALIFDIVLVGVVDKDVVEDEGIDDMVPVIED